jgi:hypothetical protein
MEPEPPPQTTTLAQEPRQVGPPSLSIIVCGLNINLPSRVSQELSTLIESLCEIDPSLAPIQTKSAVPPRDMKVDYAFLTLSPAPNPSNPSYNDRVNYLGKWIGAINTHESAAWANWNGTYKERDFARVIRISFNNTVVTEANICQWGAAA